MKRALLILILVLVVGAGLRFCLFTVPAGELAVVTQFGKPVATITEPGLRWKLPGFMQRVNRFDGRVEVFSTRPIQLLLGDKNPIIMTTFVAWRVADPLLYFRSLVARETARGKLGDMVVSALGASLAHYNLDNVINPDPAAVKLAEIEAAVLNETAGQAQANYGIEIVRVGLRRVTYPAIVADAVYNRMRAERQKEAKKYRAEGAEEAAKIEASADKEVSQILADAYKEGEIIKGAGDQEATRIFADAYSRDPEFFDFLKSIELYRKTMNERTTLILSTDSDLYHYLDSSELGR